MKEHRKAIWKRVLAWMFYILVGMLTLLVILAIFLKTQWGQNMVREYAVSWLGKKLNTRVVIGGLKTDWFHALELRDLYLEDPTGRPLASIGKLEVDYDLIAIIRGNFGADKIAIERATIQLYRARTDSEFNFNFITRAFTKDTIPPLDTTAKKTNLKLGLVSLSQIRFEMDDQYGGQHYMASSKEIRILADQIDLDEMDFKLKYFITDSVTAIVNMFESYKKSVPDTGSSSMPFSITTDSLALANTIFYLDDTSSVMRIVTKAEELSGSHVSYNLQKMFAGASSLQLSNHSTIVNMRTAKPSTKDTATNRHDSITSKPFIFDVKQLAILNNGFGLDDAGKKPGPKHAIDFAHLNLQAINVQANNLRYDGREYRAAIHQLSGREKSGFYLKQSSVVALYSDQALKLQQLQLKTGANELQGDLVMTYKSLKEISSVPSQTKITLVVKQGRLNLNEILYFEPSLANNSSFQPLLGKEFLLSTTVTGTLDNIHIPDLLVKQGTSLVRAEADVYNLPDTKRLMINLYLKQFEGTREGLLSLLPRNTIPDSLLHYIPSKFSVTGTYKGGVQNMALDLQLKSDYGDANVKGTLKNITNKKRLLIMSL